MKANICLGKRVHFRGMRRYEVDGKRIFREDSEWMDGLTVLGCLNSVTLCWSIAEFNVSRASTEWRRPHSSTVSIRNDRWAISLRLGKGNPSIFSREGASLPLHGPEGDEGRGRSPYLVIILPHIICTWRSRLCAALVCDQLRDMRQNVSH